MKTPLTAPWTILYSFVAFITIPMLYTLAAWTEDENDG